MRGPLYFAETRGLWACYPLAWWSARDVWAYLVQHDLPYNELYDIDPRGREVARNGAMFGGTQQTYAGQPAYMGRLAYIKRIYPDWFNRFAAEFPEVRCYV
jgi:phosphoadenosine phosphosulfate reductase